MLTPEELAIISAQGTTLDGEGVYYVPDSQADHWRLTLRGLMFYRQALKHYELTRELPHRMSDAQLWELKRALLRARTQALAAEVAQALEQGQLPVSERTLARSILHDSLQRAMRVAEHHCLCSRAGDNVIAGPTGR